MRELTWLVAALVMAGGLVGHASPIGPGDASPPLTEADFGDPIAVTLQMQSPGRPGEVSAALITVTTPYAELREVHVTVAGPAVLAQPPALPIALREGRGEGWLLLAARESPADIELRVTGDHAALGRLGGYLRGRLVESGGRLDFAPGPSTPDPASGVAVPAAGPRVPAGQVDRSSSMPPQPATSPAAMAPGQEPLANGTFVVTGTWNYHREDDVSLAPQRWATVRVWDDELLFDELLWQGLTGYDGSFTTPPIPTAEECCLKGNQDIYVEFALESAAVRVVDGFGSVYSWRTAVTTVGGEDVLDVGARAPDSSVWAARPFQYLTNAWDFATNEMAIAPSTLGQVRAIIPGGCTYYTRSDDTIHLCADNVTDKSPDDVGHEYGHFVHDKLYGDAYWPSPGGPHYLCQDNQDRGLAWTEGFADWFGPRANQVVAEPADTSYDRPWDGWMFTFDLEAGSYCGDDLRGDDSEMNVAWALWDLFDGVDDGAFDARIAQPHDRLADAVFRCDQPDFRGFYDGGVCSWVSRGNPPYALVATAYQNRIDYDAAPVAVLTTQATLSWAAGPVPVTAIVSDPDSPVLSVEFRYTANASCDDASVYVATDWTPPYEALVDGAVLAEGLYRTCARATDPMRAGSLRTSAAPFGIDRSPPWSTVWTLPPYTNRTTFIVGVAAGDAVGGVASVELFYRPLGRLWTSAGTDGGLPWEWSLDASTLGGDGAYEFRSQAVDLAGNAEPASSSAEAATTVDTAAPDSSAGALPPTVVTVPFPVNASASDATSGVASVELWARRESGPWGLLGTDTAAPWEWSVDPGPLGGEGGYAFYTIAVDAAGNRQPAPGPLAVTYVDTAAPSSSADPLPAYSPASFTVTATANDSGAGLAGILLFYRLDGGPWALLGSDTAAPWSWAVDTAATGGDGAYEFRTLATDGAGLQEAESDLPDATTFVDTASPVVDLQAPPPLTRDSRLRIAATISDEGSGIAQVLLSFRRDEGAWADSPALLSAPWTWDLDASLLGGDGAYEFRVTAADRAGNVFLTPVRASRVDTEAPTARVLPTLPAFTNATAVNVTAAASDAGSGVLAVQLRARRDGGPWQPLAERTQPPYAWTVDLLPLGGDGFHEFAAVATDAAGNEEPLEAPEANVTLDRVAPTVAVTVPDWDDVLTSATVAIEWEGADMAGALDHMFLVLDGGEPILVNATGPYWATLGEGLHVVEVTAVDRAGNHASASTRFYVNTAPYWLFFLAFSMAAGLLLLLWWRRWNREETASGRPKRPTL